MIIGIVLGIIFGAICSFIPNFNVGVILMIVSNISPEQIPADNLIGFIIGAYSINSIFTNLSKLPVASKLVNEQVNLTSLPQTDRSEYYSVHSKCFHNYISSELIGRVYGLILSIGIIMLMYKNDIKLDTLGKGLAEVMVVSIVYYIPIIRGNNVREKIWVIISLIGSSILGLCIVNIDFGDSGSRYNMIILITCMFLPNSLRNIRGGGGDRELIIPKEDKDNGGIPIVSGVLCGIISSIFWGLPINVVCKGLEEEEDTALIIAGRKGLASGINNALSLMLFLVIGSTRGQLGQNLAQIHENLNGVEVVGILIVNFVIYFIGLMYFERIIKMYVKIYNNIPNKLVTKGMVIVSLISIIIISRGWAVPILLSVMMIDKIIKEANGDKEIKLAALSIIPMMTLM